MLDTNECSCYNPLIERLFYGVQWLVRPQTAWLVATFFTMGQACAFGVLGYALQQAEGRLLKTDA